MNILLHDCLIAFSSSNYITPPISMSDSSSESLFVILL